jgi:large repetitive protein
MVTIASCIMKLLLLTLTHLLRAGQSLALAGFRAPALARRSSFSCLAAFSLLVALAPAGVFAQGISISPTSLPNPFLGISYSQTLTAFGGTGTKSFAVTAGTLPTGLSLTSTGLISGVPTATGSFIFLVTATDSNGPVVSAGYTLVVQGPPTVTTPTVANVAAGSATMGGNVTSDGGSPINARGVVYALSTSNANPELGGFGVSSAPVTGTSTTGAFTVAVTGLAQGSTYSFKAYATNGLGTSYSPVGTFTTNTLIFSPVTLPSVVTGIDYAQNIIVSGGSGSYTYAITSGALPTGLTISTGGFISGIPTVEGSYSFTITVTDAAGATRSQGYTLDITPAVAITTTALPDWGVNLPGYGFNVQATGGTGAKTFSITDGTLPFGLTLDSSGLITGTPTLGSTFVFTITASDAIGGSASRTYTVVIGAPVTISTAAVSDATLNQSNYRQPIASFGGTGFKTLSVSAGSLPPGMGLDANGVLTGSPSATGTYSFTITATDILGASVSRSYSMVVNPALSIATTSLTNIPVALATTQTITATGGTGAKVFTVTSGTLPAGLTLSPGGVLGGTPTTAGTSNFTITVTDAAGATASQAYSIVAGGAVAISPTTLTAPVINVSGYSATISATGGTGAKSFAVTSGSLPTGLSLSSGGVLSGTATAAGTYNFTVTATDAAGVTANQAYTLVVSPPVNVPQTITFGALPSRIGTDAPFVLSATATSGLPVSFNVTGPATLNGNTLTLTGVPGIVTITASQPGNGSFAAATTVSQSFAVTAADRLINLSSRVRIAPDASRSLIAGFVIGGQQPKRVLLRAIGPGLVGFGVTGALVNPKLQVFDSSGRVVVENDDWSGADTSAAFLQVGAFTLAAGSKDAALLTTLAPGSYTMQITAGTETGIALAEVYDASPNPGGEVQRLVNISTRGTVESGDGVLIGGFSISGTRPKRVLIRGVGPSLGLFNVTGALADPRISIYSGTTVIAQNDDWSVPSSTAGQPVPATAAELAAAAQSVGAFALTAGSRDAAVILTLAPGSYTAQVAGAGTTSGVALVEVYEMP